MKQKVDESFFAQGAGAPAMSWNNVLAIQCGK